MHVLIIGGTRNVGHFLCLALLEAGHRVTILNRGRTPDELPAGVERLRGDRSERADLEAALGRRSFDAVVDTTLYNREDAQAAAELLSGRVGHYLFLSSGQVYLVREGLRRPFVEADFDGPVMSPPQPRTRDYENWFYGVQKRRAEEALETAWQQTGFPFTTFRLPMVNGERDHFQRIFNYWLRLKDGGPILLPEGPHLRLRHVDSQDVVRAILSILQSGAGKGCAYNIGQDETLTIEDFLELLGTVAGLRPRITRLPEAVLTHHGLIPDCSPFSDPWMSELDNARGNAELGLRYTPVRETIQRLCAFFEATKPPAPEGYLRRAEEIRLADSQN